MTEHSSHRNRLNPDRSGSMSPLTGAAISGFNRFLKVQQEAKGIARMTLVVFDDKYLVPADNLPVEEIVEMGTTTFVARGLTALLDPRCTCFWGRAWTVNRLGIRTSRRRVCQLEGRLT